MGGGPYAPDVVRGRPSVVAVNAEQDLDVEHRDERIDLVGQHQQTHRAEIVGRIREVARRAEEIAFTHDAHPVNVMRPNLCSCQAKIYPHYPQKITMFARACRRLSASARALSE